MNQQATQQKLTSNHAGNAPSTPVAIDVKDVVNRFGTHTVHDGVSLQIHKGEIIGLVGGSGSGKSVLMRTILGLHTPNKGSITFYGKKKRTPSDFGVLFQRGALFSGLTVEENVMVPLREHTKLSEADMRSLARVKIALSGLPPEAAGKYPSELSGGMVKRAALARALALDPPVLFLDEPTAGLDPIGATEFDALILQLQQMLGMTVVIITHDLDTLFSICTRVAVLVDKKIVIDSLDALMQSEHPWLQEYFHGPRAQAARHITSPLRDSDLAQEF
jgi:phospholipid/cholesterol/gamma-HCH transport system ATP-binding protein